MTKVNELHRKWLNDPSYKADFEAITEEFEIASAIIEARNLAGLTQSELAKRLKAKQSLVARLESGADNTTIKTLQRIAEATGTYLRSLLNNLDDFSGFPRRSVLGRGVPYPPIAP